MLIRALRIGLGQLILLLDFITRPRRLQRTPEAQAAVDGEVAGLTLYQFHACPFCIKTRRSLRRLNLSPVLRDTKTEEHRQALLAGGGKLQVPCLRIETADGVHWLYESSAIIAYLEERFASR